MRSSPENPWCAGRELTGRVLMTTVAGGQVAYRLRSFSLGVAAVSAGYILLEDGAHFDGELCGHPDAVTGEVVFNTAMTGYQESVTDPSCAARSSSSPIP